MILHGFVYTFTVEVEDQTGDGLEEEFSMTKSLSVRSVGRRATLQIHGRSSMQMDKQPSEQMGKQASMPMSRHCSEMTMENRFSIAMGSSASCISHIGANSELGRNIDKGKRRAKTVEEKALKVIKRKTS